MQTIDPQGLPYPWPEGVDPMSTKWGRSWKDERRQVGALREGRFDEAAAVRFSGALAAGSALVTAPRERGYANAHLAFYQEGIGIFFEDGQKERLSTSSSSGSVCDVASSSAS